LNIDSAIKTDALSQMGFTPFRKKQIIIKAKQMPRPFLVETIEGMMQGKANDYLIIGIHNESYPIDKEIFEKTYEYFCNNCKCWHDVNNLNENHPASFFIE